MINEAIKNDQSFRDKVATVDKAGKRLWIFPIKPHGRLYNVRSILSVAYLIIFFTLPFLQFKGHPLFLFNILERRFILFGQIFWPQDFFIFGLGMTLFIVFVALFTIVFGRVFCGWACPQTIFMEMVFRRIEYWIEGNGKKQQMLKNAPWTVRKMSIKMFKWAVFWLLSFVIANTFLAYVIGVDELKKIITGPPGKHIGGLTSIVIFTSVFFLVYSWFREQVCTVVCPYGRMQGVLLDRNSLVVAYDYTRGELRGRYKKNEQRTIGDCIDCRQCVQVCPTGIDIRNGTQLECINCTACIDACNHMMSAIGMDPGLIRMASESNISDRLPFRFTAKIKGYILVMCILLGVLTYLLASRTDVGITLLRTPGQLFQQLSGNRVSNLYNYKLLNKTYGSKLLMLKPENFNGDISIVGQEKLLVPGEKYVSGSLFISLPQEHVVNRKTLLKIGVWEGNRKVGVITTTFLGPFNAN